jgi:hypothetical protein
LERFLKKPPVIVLPVPPDPPPWARGADVLGDLNLWNKVRLEATVELRDALAAGVRELDAEIKALERQVGPLK